MQQETLKPSLGARLLAKGTEFSVFSKHAEKIELCLFDAEGEAEMKRLPMTREGEVHRLFVNGVGEGTRYGFRAHGTYDPDQGLWFDPSKLLVDPYAITLDRSFRHDARLTVFGEETQDLVPKAIVTAPLPPIAKRPTVQPGGLIYEVAVKPFTILRQDIPEAQRGTVSALAHPSIIAHLKRIGVDVVELMPIPAWIDERHLPPLGLSNGWGYNPVAFMALDPRIVPGGIKELRDTVAALHEEGIAVILDLVFNHTGESDRQGATLSLRGLDNLSAYRHVPGQPGTLVNDTGTGNTVDCDDPYIRRLLLDSLRHFVLQAGVDGFRFDLAPIIGRTDRGFEAEGETLRAMLADDVLGDRLLIAEPWDIGPGGYQLGNFPAPFLEWNDRARDDMRLYWRGDDGKTGNLATVLAGSSDIFGRDGRTHTRTVNFLAAHDGFTLMDLVSNASKHNEANGENNRDGHNENYSWNNGIEGATDDPEIIAARRRDAGALLATLFASRGTIMLTAGDEGGRSQHGNNNAYCQDNEITWVDWSKLDEELIAQTAFLSSLRKRFAVFTETAFFTGNGDIVWLSTDGEPMTVSQWGTPSLSAFGMGLETLDNETGKPARLAILINRGRSEQVFAINRQQDTQWRWLTTEGETEVDGSHSVAPRSVHFLLGY
jgi:glycogen operon protein